MIKQAAILALALAAGACASTEVGLTAGETALGAAVRQNIAAQTVNATPSTAAVTHDGARTTSAVTAYQRDEVEKPGPAGTTGGSASGGSGG